MSTSSSGSHLPGSFRSPTEHPASAFSASSISDASMTRVRSASTAPFALLHFRHGAIDVHPNLLIILRQAQVTIQQRRSFIEDGLLDEALAQEVGIRIFQNSRPTLQSVRSLIVTPRLARHLVDVAQALHTSNRIDGAARRSRAEGGSRRPSGVNEGAEGEAERYRRALRQDEDREQPSRDGEDSGCLACRTLDKAQGYASAGRRLIIAYHPSRSFYNALREHTHRADSHQRWPHLAQDLATILLFSSPKTLLDVLAELALTRDGFNYIPVTLLAREYNVFQWNSHRAVHSRAMWLNVIFSGQMDQHDQPYTWTAVDRSWAGDAQAAGRVWGMVQLGILCLDAPPGVHDSGDRQPELGMWSEVFRVGLAYLCTAALLFGILLGETPPISGLSVGLIALLPIQYYLSARRRARRAAETIWWTVPEGTGEVEWRAAEDGRLPIRQRPQVIDDDSAGEFDEGGLARDEDAELSESEQMESPVGTDTSDSEAG